MRQFLLLILFFFGLATSTLAQQEIIKDSTTIGDPKYREDQFYVGLTYNFLSNKPAGLSQQGFSVGLHAGFIRDLPINKARNFGFGAGLGYSSNSYNQNLLIRESGDITEYQLLNNDEVRYTKNKLNIHILEVPLQIRWRTSTPHSHKFWRIYAGVKLGYVLNNISKHKGDLGNFKSRNLKHIHRFQSTLDFSFGYNTWNFYVAYGLQPLLKKEAKVNNETIAIRTINFGLIFYIY